MSSGATTCYKKKTCSEGGYYSSVPTDQKCSSKDYNGYNCYTNCTYKTCSDYGYEASIPSGKTCTTVYPRSGLTCYKDCQDTGPSSCTDPGYYDGYSCSTWKSYPTYGDCSQGYSEMATSAKCDPYLHVSTCKDGTSAGLRCNGLGGDEAARCYAQCYGDCDVDSWRRCCHQCNGGL